MAALTAAALALTAASTAMNFSAQQSAARGAKRQGEYEAGIYEQDADIAAGQATDAIDRGRQAEGRQRTVTKQTVGAQRAQMAASGIDLGVGSASDVQEDTARIGELEALTIRNNAKREAYGYEVQAMDLRSRATLARMGGATTAASLRNQSYGTLLNGALQTYGIGKDLYGEFQASGTRRTIGRATDIGRGVAGGGYYQGY